MAIYNFQSYPAISKATFDCPQCGKVKRTRTFRAECTVNPFNTRPDGQVRTASEVRKQSAEDASRQRDQFMSRPLCATCENGLSYADRKVVYDARRSSLSSPQASAE